ncbi:MAG: hypothetical protein SFX18_15725 [Pirellulales bacterium]|nr:hypothetical protein [Pirellulales bacterium]
MATLECGLLRLRFVRQADRIGQWIDFRTSTDAPWSELAHSIEGTADQIWPPSPPWQHLHLENRPAGTVALLLGMSGQAHWSGSIQATADGILWEIACRTPGPAEFLGNTWNSHADGQKIPAWRVLEHQHTLTYVKERIVIQASPVAANFPQTVIWSFMLSLT